MTHGEHHRSHRTGWLRAAVLGANDGIVSTASLIIGVAVASTVHEHVIVAGLAGLVAGAMSMAAGEYVSVSSQADTERADLKIEEDSLRENVELEHEELAEIYRNRGLEPELAAEVAGALMAHDALGAQGIERPLIGVIQLDGRVSAPGSDEVPRHAAPARREAVRAVVGRVRAQHEEVVALRRDGDGFVVTSHTAVGERQRRAHAVALATGYFHRPRRLAVPGEERSWVHSRYREPYRHFGETVAVVAFTPALSAMVASTIVKSRASSSVTSMAA